MRFCLCIFAFNVFVCRWVLPRLGYIITNSLCWRDINTNIRWSVYGFRKQWEYRLLWILPSWSYTVIVNNKQVQWRLLVEQNRSCGLWFKYTYFPMKNSEFLMRPQAIMLHENCGSFGWNYPKNLITEIITFFGMYIYALTSLQCMYELH